MSIMWPPCSLDENDALFRDDHTRLPTALYPFFMRRGWDENSRPAGPWRVEYNPERGKASKKILGEYHDIFDAFEAMLAAYREWFPKRPEERVYFIGTELRVGAMVKIGFSRNPEARLRALQTSHHERLQIFATVPGGRRDEQEYHHRWRRRRTSGEWFTLGDCIIDAIKLLQAEGADQMISGGSHG